MSGKGNPPEKVFGSDLHHCGNYIETRHGKVITRPDNLFRTRLGDKIIIYGGCQIMADHSATQPHITPEDCVVWRVEGQDAKWSFIGFNDSSYTVDENGVITFNCSGSSEECFFVEEEDGITINS